MVFKRRNPRTYLQIIAEAFWPRGGWTRAFHYVKHRIRRLPDNPGSIARGVAAGVFVSFTPFFGFHFVTAFLVARLVRGNVLAALLGTFFGNPVTFPIIAISSLQIGHFILGTTFDPASHITLFGEFVGAGKDLKQNVIALFTDQRAHWGNLIGFFERVFLPYLVGGFVPGLIAGIISYWVSEPLIAAYQKHRRKKLRDRLEKLREKLHARAEERRDRGKGEL